MLFNWGKKKLKPEEVARMFVHATLDSVEDAWPEVLGLMRETPHLEHHPEIEDVRTSWHISSPEASARFPRISVRFSGACN